MEETQEMTAMTNKVNIEFLRDQLEKDLSDIEELKDKVPGQMLITGRINRQIIDYIESRWRKYD